MGHIKAFHIFTSLIVPPGLLPQQLLLSGREH
jgi:hypothetical protein